MIALDNDVDDARASAQALVDNGFDRDAISLCMWDPRADEPVIPQELRHDKWWRSRCTAGS